MVDWLIYPLKLGQMTPQINDNRGNCGRGKSVIPPSSAPDDH